LFANVLKKFFTARPKTENKQVTKRSQEVAPMIRTARTALRNAPATLAQDFLGASALVALLLAGLTLPGMF